MKVKVKVKVKVSLEDPAALLVHRCKSQLELTRNLAEINQLLTQRANR